MKGDCSPTSFLEEQISVDFAIKGYMGLCSSNHAGLRLLNRAFQCRGAEMKSVRWEFVQ